MFQSLSPYALLRASRPKLPETSQYDLYSLSQMNSPLSAPSVQQESIAWESLPHTQAAPVRQTHYIADIHTRHASAMRRASQSSDSL